MGDFVRCRRYLLRETAPTDIKVIYIGGLLGDSEAGRFISDDAVWDLREMCVNEIYEEHAISENVQENYETGEIRKR